MTTAVSAQHLLATVWGTQPGWVFLPEKRLSGQWYEAFAMPWPLPEEGIQLFPQGDQYFCPLVFSQPYRRAEYALPTRFLWADLDGADLSKTRLRPSAVWETSGGGFPAASPHYHALWWMKRRMTARLAASLSRRIAYAEPGADRGGWDVTQVLRVPGTLNHKRDRAGTGQPQQVRLLWAKKLVYTREEVESAYPPVVRGTPIELQEWPTCHDDVPLALASLPHSLRRSLSFSSGEIAALDRSLHISILAEKLLRAGLTPPLASLVLDTSTLVESKYGGRNDRHTRVLAEVAKASERLTATLSSAHP